MTASKQAPADRAPMRVGQVLRGKWRLDELLAVGGMASVFAATHRNGKRGAVKLLHYELSLNEESRSRFLREGYVANKVDHEGAVSVLDDDVCDDGTVFLVMELLEGQTVDALLRVRQTKTFGLGETLRVADRLLDVLAVAHEKGIVHRDIKPENIFITRSGKLKVLDFGIARLREATATAGTTQNGDLLGTPSFMSPEQALGNLEQIDARSDLWSVGATLFRLLTGRPVHNADTINRVLLAAMTMPAPPIGSILPSLPAELAATIDRALTFDPKDRWPNAREMRAALRAFADRGGTRLEGPVLNSADEAKARPTTLPLEKSGAPAVEWPGGPPAGAPATLVYASPSPGVHSASDASAGPAAPRPAAGAPAVAPVALGAALPPAPAPAPRADVYAPVLPGVHTPAPPPPRGYAPTEPFMGESGLLPDDEDAKTVMLATGAQPQAAPPAPTPTEPPPPPVYAPAFNVPPPHLATGSGLHAAPASSAPAPSFGPAPPVSRDPNPSFSSITRDPNPSFGSVSRDPNPSFSSVSRDPNPSFSTASPVSRDPTFGQPRRSSRIAPVVVLAVAVAVLGGIAAVVLLGRSSSPEEGTAAAAATSAVATGASPPALTATTDSASEPAPSAGATAASASVTGAVTAAPGASAAASGAKGAPPGQKRPAGGGGAKSDPFSSRKW